MNNLVERTLSVVLTLSAVALVGIEVRREFAPREPTRAGRVSEYVKNWRDGMPSASTIGSPNAPVTLTVFTDFQCPFCKRFHDVASSVRNRFGDDVAIAVVHTPLPGHSAAVPAARAAECAAKSGRFAEVVNALYARQDSLGKVPWNSVALGAGIQDTVTFAACMADSTSAPKLVTGRAFATKLGVNSTPTVMLNGWRYAVPPSDTELVRAIRDILDRKPPYKGFKSDGLVARK